jgi:hypothetical protein
VTRQAIVQLLDSIVTLLTAVGESRWAGVIDQRRSSLRAAEPGTHEYQAAVRSGLRLFGGMGSFQDLVLQDRSGVLPEQPELGRLKQELFTALQDELQ